MPLLLIFIVMPILEMWLLITVGSRIGALPTIGLVLLTAMIGLALLRRQGAKALIRANQRMEQGEMPLQEMVEGIFLAVGGVLLLTPGFITDALGFFCLIPGLRQLLIGHLLRPVIMQTASRAGTFYRYERRADGSEDIIEGEYYHHRDPSDPDDKRLR